MLLSVNVHICEKSKSMQTQVIQIEKQNQMLPKDRTYLSDKKVLIEEIITCTEMVTEASRIS